ncbi:MAG: hypothetical protein ABIJ31_13270 [Pseudomonadota bacterium]
MFANLVDSNAINVNLKDNVKDIVEDGRARWRVENENNDDIRALTRYIYFDNWNFLLDHFVCIG